MNFNKTETKMNKIQALDKLNIRENSQFKEDLQLYMDNKDLSPEEKYERLQIGGVNNWSGYEFAIDDAEIYGEDWYDLSNVDKLTYLENAGVDNWEWYSESLYPEVNPYEVSDEDIVECFEENEEYYARNWSSYTEYLNLIE